MSNPYYKARDIVVYISLMLGLYATMKVTGGASFVLFTPFLITSLARKRVEDTVFWMMVGICSLSINAYFVPKGSIYGYVHRFTFMLFGLIGLIQLGGQRKSPIIVSLLGMIGFLAYMIIPSSIGWWPIVSFMKIILFGSIYMALISMTNTALTAPKFDIPKLRSAFLSVAIVIVLGSILIMPFPAISYMRPEELGGTFSGGSLFKGMTNHSQWMGPLASAFCVVLLGDMLFAIQRWDKLYSLIIVCCPVLVYKTASRTAMGTLIIGVACLIFFFLKERRVKNKWKAKAYFVITCFVMLAGILVLAVPSTRDHIAKFVLKYDDEATVNDLNMEDALVTRMGLVEIQMDNFRKKPLIGNGFQVSEEMQYMAEHSSGMLMTAPIEKGVWVSAVLEEGGVVGMLIYIGFLLWAFIVTLKKRAYITATVFVSLHVSNLGEFTMFSMSGCGGQWWMLLFVAIIFDVWRSKQFNKQLWPPRMIASRTVGYNPIWR